MNMTDMIGSRIEAGAPDALLEQRGGKTAGLRQDLQPPLLIEIEQDPATVEDHGTRQHHPQPQDHDPIYHNPFGGPGLRPCPKAAAPLIVARKITFHHIEGAST